jgi:HlyD family secretion protein
MTQLSSRNKALVLAAALVALLLAGGYAWRQWDAAHQNDGLAGGNGRIEATEVDVATKYAGRVAEILVREGDFVQAGQPLARMQVDSLLAQRREAEAGREQARQAVAAARAQVALRESEHAAAQAQIGAPCAPRRWRTRAPCPCRSWTTTARAYAACRPR